MTEQEAMQGIKNEMECVLSEHSTSYFDECLEVAYKALEEVQQYRALGTVEELKEAEEKQKPKKPITYKDTNRADCPICGATVRGINKPFGDWCSKCGNRLDWGNEDE